jgi:hypothetical protein
MSVHRSAGEAAHIADKNLLSAQPTRYAGLDRAICIDLAGGLFNAFR